VRQVIRQTKARIFGGETRIEGKIFSLFQPSTEIIRKGKAGKPNEFGKMVKIQEAVPRRRPPINCRNQAFCAEK
jgi:IS5 family transposase